MLGADAMCHPGVSVRVAEPFAEPFAVQSKSLQNTGYPPLRKGRSCGAFMPSSISWDDLYYEGSSRAGVAALNLYLSG
jgi:hypothetical protein